MVRFLHDSYIPVCPLETDQTFQQPTFLNIRKKAQLFRQAKRLGSERAWLKYTQARNKVTSSLRAAKTTYFDQLASKLNSPRDFWSAIHKPAPKKDRIPVNLTHNNVTASTSLQKANLLNKFFSSCFSAPPPARSTPSSDHSGPSLSSVTCTQDEVHNLLASHKLHTATGPDGISSHMLRATADSISLALTTTFNDSLAQSKVPDAWKISNVTPLVKSGRTSL